MNILEFAFALVMLFISNLVYANPTSDWAMWLQEPASNVMEHLSGVHDILFKIITVIFLFVLCLVVYTCYRFSAKRNPIPSKTTHNTKLEIIWTSIPIAILLFIAMPTFKAIYFIETQPKNIDLTLKVTAHQWYWEYEYPDYNIKFDSYIIPDNEIKPGQVRLLDVDNKVVIPVGANISVLVTSADVIHDWAIPALGMKIDAVPGRVNETWFNATKTGTFYGQCSQLCGTGHGFMPIALDVVSQEEFRKWIEAKKSA